MCVSSMPTLTMIMMVLAMVLSSPVSAFLIDTSTTTSPLLLRTNVYSKYRTSITAVTKTIRPTTQLQMAITKSGGRQIQSNEQFQTEVLLLTPKDIQNDDDDTVSQTNSDTQIHENENPDNDDINSNKDNTQTKTPTTPPTTQALKPILVFYSAPWCGPCRLSNPVVREIIRQFVPRIDVVEVCTDDLPEVAETAGVESIPTIQMYYRGELLDTIVGCVAKNVLSSAVKKILEDLGCFGDGGEAGLGSVVD